MGVDLNGKTALVIGASSGMGRAAVVALSREGVRVAAAARREGLLAELRDQMAREGRAIEAAAVDVTVRESVERVVASAVQTLGGIDFLVYSAGTNIPDRSMKLLTAETWEMMLAVNLTGAFHATKAILPSMRERGGGLIIYISSIATHLVDLSGASYHASKRGLNGLAHATREEEKANGIRTCCILPGLCRTDLIKKRPVPTPPEVLDRALLPEDVADMVVAVARLDPRAVTPEIELIPSRL